MKIKNCEVDVNRVIDQLMRNRVKVDQLILVHTNTSSWKGRTTPSMFGIFAGLRKGDNPSITVRWLEDGDSMDIEVYQITKIEIIPPIKIVEVLNGFAGVKNGTSRRGGHELLGALKKVFDICPND